MKRVEESSLVARNSIFTSNFASTFCNIRFYTTNANYGDNWKAEGGSFTAIPAKKHGYGTISPIENWAAENALNAMYWSFMEN